MKVILLLILSLSAFAQIDIEIRHNYRQECLEIKSFIEKDYSVTCNYNYHHFNVNAYRENYSRSKARSKGKVRIAGFNVLHPGMSKTRYKDYNRIAEIIDQFDVVGVTELLPLISGDLKNNQAVIKFLKETPNEIKELREEIKELAARQDSRSTKKMKELIAELESLEQDLSKAQDLYRMPGYLEILHALRERRGGKEWALILSPRGEAAKETDVQELVGYYYRSSKVKPKVNQYCKEIRSAGRGTPFACIPNMGKKMLGESKKDIFSRRPFLAEFISGKFSFALLASHVVYNSPTDEKEMKNILQKSFGVDHYDELSIGANKANYARFAEVKVTMDFMEQLRTRFNQKDVILIGDLNLDHENQFWEHVLPSMPGAEIYVKELSTVSDKLEDINGTPTNGLASAFDHFIFDPKETDECTNNNREVDAKVFNFYNGSVGGNVRRTYRVRKETMLAGKFVKDTTKYRKVENARVIPFKKGDESIYTIGRKKIKVGTKTISVKGIISDDKAIEKFISGFYERILDSQFDPNSYYEYFRQTLSDHMPIYMNCNN